MRSLLKPSLLVGVSFLALTSPAYAATCESFTGSTTCSVDSAKVITGASENTISTTGTITLNAPVYQTGNYGLVVQMSGSNPPTLNFRGGSLWDTSSYYYKPDDFSGEVNLTDTGQQAGALSTGLKYSGDIVIQNGYFDGAVRLYKGSDTNKEVYTGSDGSQKEFNVISDGNIRIYGGKFYFYDVHQNAKNYESEILLNKNLAVSGENSGNVFLYDPTFNVGYVLNSANPDDLSTTALATVTVGSKNIKPTEFEPALYMYGGTYNISDKGVLHLSATTITLQNDENYRPINFSGSGKLAFTTTGGSATIESQIYWNDGTIELTTGTLILNNNVTISKFLFGNNDGSTLSISNGVRLTVLDDLTMLGTTRLTGAGELFLNEDASATFGALDFGTIRVTEGTVSFVGNTLLSNLYGGKGVLNINAPVSVENLYLESSQLVINEGLNVTNLDFGLSGSIKFTADKSLTLRSDSTIYNTKTIDTSSSNGTITIASGFGLNFADEDSALGQEFVSAGLNLQIEEGSSLNFNGTKATVNDITVKRGSANFNTGTTNIGALIIGDAGALEEGTNTTATVAQGAYVKADSALALLGAQLVVNGDLTVGTLQTNGGKETYSTISGSGNITVTESALFNGLLNNFYSVTVDASQSTGTGTTVTADFAGSTGKDSISVLTLKSSATKKATANLTGSLTLDSLNFDEQYGGVVNIEKDVVLGIRNTSDISGENATKNVIKGDGTLELLGSTSINFGGSGEYLGGLKIGTGTATITQEADLGSVSFASSAGGTLNIIDGVVLNVNSSVTTTGTNKITGGGTLKLVGNANGTFGASIADLGKLEIGNGTALFNYNASLENVAFTSGGTGKIEIAKGIVVTLSNSLNLATTNSIVGLGTLNLAGDANAVLNTGSDTLGYLVVGSGTVSFNKSSSLNNLSFSSGEGGSVQIGSGLTLTINNTLNSSGTNKISGNGTLILNDGAVANFSARLTSLMNLDIKAATATFNANAILHNVTFSTGNGVINIGNGARVMLMEDLSIGGTSNITGPGTLYVGVGKTLTVSSSISGLGNLTIGVGSTARFNNNSSVGSVSFSSNTAASTLYLDAGQTLSVTNNITVGENNAIDGTGTLLLSGNATGVFGGSDDIEGTLKIDRGTASFTEDKTVGNIAFVSGSGGTIDIASGASLMIDTNIATTGVNAITGEGTLALKGGANASFGAQISSLGALSIGMGKAALNANAYIGKVTFDSSMGGELNIAAGKTLTLYSDISTSGGNILSGGGVLNLADGVNADIGAIISDLGGIRIGSGSLNINEAATVGSVAFAGSEGEINIASGRTLSLLSDFSMSAKNSLKGDGTLALKNNAGAVFNTALDFNGTLSAEAGTVRFNTAGTVGTVKIGTGGVLDLDVNKLTAAGVELGTGSTLALRITRSATDDNGNLRGGNFGVLNANTVNVFGPSTLFVTVDYGLVTSVNGTLFQLIEGTVNNGNAFTVSNNRYRFEKTECAGGLCYTIYQSSNGADAAEEAGGSQNNQNTAGAFLDGRFFAEGTDLAKIAEHLDYLSQHYPVEYTNALTALAPDVTGASTRLPMNVSGKIMDTLSRRMSALSPTMGTDYRYRHQNIYGRSGGSPYDYKWMPSGDYFRRAGYNDNAQETPVRQKYRPRALQEEDLPSASDPHYREIMTPAERREDALRRRARERQDEKTGLWAQMFFNASEFISSSDPKGFSGNTTGLAVGIDAQVYDGIIAGVGYAYTTSSIDALQRDKDMTGNSLFLYSMYKPANWFVSGVFNYSKFSSEETKNLSGIVIGDDYDSSAYGLQISAGYDFGWWKPSAGLRYTSSSVDGHADSVGQQIGSISDTVTTFLLEARFSKEYPSEDGEHLWKPELRVGLGYDLSSEADRASVYLPNGSFYNVEGETLEKTSFELGIGVTYLISDKTDLYFGYNGEFRKDYASHTGMLNLRYNF